MNRLKNHLFIIVLALPIQSFALTYTCNTLKKVGSGHEYSKEELERYPFFTLLDTNEDNAVYISRCVYIEKNLQCKKMKVDKVVHDAYVPITKFYVFEPQYNFQLFKAWD